MPIGHIATDKLSRGRLPVYVTRVESPTLFWVQLKYNRDELLELQEKIAWKMQRRRSRFFLWPHAVRLGLLVAVKEGNEWYRGVITSTIDTTAIINLGDWGRTIKRPFTQLYQLPEQYHRLHWQAFACGIDGIKPVGSSLTWPKKTRDITQLLIENEEGWIQIRNSIGGKAATSTYPGLTK